MKGWGEESTSPDETLPVFERLYELYFERIYRYIALRVGSPFEAEDLTSETFLRAWEHLPSYRPRGVPISAWLFRIAVNLCRDHLRRVKVRQIITPFHWYEKVGKEHVFMDITQNPQKHLEQSEKSDIILESISKLPSSLRIVFVLRDIQDLSYDEISKALKWPLGTVKTRLYRARRKLAEIMRPYLEEL